MTQSKIILDELLKDWVANDPILSKHFDVFIDPGHLTVGDSISNWAYIISTINVVCHKPPLQPRRRKLFRDQRYIRSREEFHHPIVFILDDSVELRNGHFIGRKKKETFQAHDPQFFTWLKDVMYLMHKVHFGKSCPLGRTDLDLATNKAQA